MQPITNQDGGTAGMGAKETPAPKSAEHNASGPTDKGMGSDVETRGWRASGGPVVTSIKPLVDGPND